MEDFMFKTRKPTKSQPAPMSHPRCVRVYRESMDSVVLQIRMDASIVSVSLETSTAKEVAKALTTTADYDI